MIPLPSKTTPPTKKSDEVIIPLLYYVQRIQRLMYEIPSDEEALKLLEENFSPETTFEWNYEKLHFDDFKNFVQNWRSRYTFLEFKFHEAIASPDPSDPEGRGGTLGFGMRGRVIGKDDGKIYEGRVHAIFKVEWVPGQNGGEDRRVITRSNQVLQGPYVIEEERRGGSFSTPGEDFG
ncbi:hypothetical protein BO99DRAFT_431858 [Aspergillus violaceofuscus CBS 115571]|uniref:Uncharacterized protein n=1 Tax=Aspergillus violaceofuscus (strain CBS 115571) TaxID=1450538 RepID=A0A2V5IK51_ASPV1|nr:hypothetical protein BO99DRAFT_431858 [Aspergillus violaceofuscus CBS 115571]